MTKEELIKEIEALRKMLKEAHERNPYSDAYDYDYWELFQLEKELEKYE